MAGLKSLKRLDLTGARITDEGLQILAGLDNLEELFLGGTSITDEGLRHLSRLHKLEKLGLRGTKVTDEGLKRLATLPNLAWLLIPETQVTPAGLAQLKDFPRLFWLVIDSSQLTPASSRALGELPKLRALWLIGRGAELGTVDGLPELTVLGLEGTQRLEIASGSLKKIQNLVLSGVSKQVTDEILSHLEEIKTLRAAEIRQGWLPSGEVDTRVDLHLTPERLERLKQQFPKARITADFGSRQSGESGTKSE